MDFNGVQTKKLPAPRYREMEYDDNRMLGLGNSPGEAELVPRRTLEMGITIVRPASHLSFPSPGRVSPKIVPPPIPSSLTFQPSLLAELNSAFNFS